MASTGEPYGLFWNSNNGDRTYDASSFEYWLKKFFTSGVFNGDLQVQATSGMTLKVGSGYANVDGKVRFWNAEFNLTLSPANSTYPRIDTVVITRDNVNRNITCEVVTGAYSGDTPQPTAPTRNAEIYQLVLAQIYVGNGVTEITQANITDTRPDTTLCGYITGTVTEMDFSQFTAQFESYFAQFKSQHEHDWSVWEQTQVAAYAAWFANVQAQQIADKADWDEWYADLQEELHNLPADSAEYLQIQIDEIRDNGTTGSIFHITTTNTELEGKTVTVSCGTEVRTATFDANLECTVVGFKSVGNVTFTSTDGIQTATRILDIDCYSKYEVSIAFWSATVNIQGDDNLKGATVTVKDSDDVTVGTVTLNAVTAQGTFTATKADTYTFSVTYDGKVYSETLVVTQETTYTLQIATVPEGATVTPVNDIQIWLHCAGIYDKTYTTLDEVLADNTTLLALISSNNAVDYMVRSTEWSGLELIPIMTSNTAPSGECIYSTQNSNGNAYLAFDGDASTFWSPSSMSNAWVGYKFTSAICAKKAVVKNNQAATISIDASNDLSNWTPLKSDISVTHATMTEIDLSDNETAYLAYRVRATGNTSGIYVFALYEGYSNDYITTNQTAMGYIGNNDYAADTLLADATWCEAICNSDYYESVLNVKVPTMTSNTTPSGVASASDYYGAGYEAFHAFDGNTATQWHSSTQTGGWVQYAFTEDVKVYKALYNVTTNPTSFKIQGSKDNSSFKDLTEDITPQTAQQDHSLILSKNIDDYKYYRMNQTKSGYVMCSKLQFYGRA